MKKCEICAELFAKFPSSRSKKQGMPKFAPSNENIAIVKYDRILSSILEHVITLVEWI